MPVTWTLRVRAAAISWAAWRLSRLIQRGAGGFEAQEDFCLCVGDAFFVGKVFDVRVGDDGDDRDMRAHHAVSGVISPAWFMPISKTA